MASTAKTGTDTPAMRQYRGFKEAHPGCVLFFRMGDFYEMFFEDAELAHRVLGVTLTRRTEGVPMAGVPYHSVEGYLRRMIQAGHRVAVCEQVEEASQAKGVVKRDVTRVITPGTLTDETLLADEQVNPCAAVVFHGSDSGGGDDRASLAWAELSTGSFAVATVEVDGLADELARVGPGELLYCETADGEVPPRVANLPTEAAKTGRPGWQFRPAEALEALRRQYRVASLAGFGLSDDDPAVGAAGGLLAYLLETQKRNEASGGDGVLPHLRPPRAVVQSRHLVIDRASLASLEVESTLRGGDEGSLLGVFRRGGCVTAMGKRLLRDWLCYPLAKREPIEARQRVVRALVDDRRFAEELAAALDGLHDVPRITARLAVDRATPRDVVGLGRSAAAAERLTEVLADRPPTAAWAERLDAVRGELDAMAKRIAEACKDEDVPAHLRDGGLIRDGFDAELDEQRTLKRDANHWLAGYQKKLIDRTGVASLKVGFNKVFGYYIEVTAANRAKMEGFLSDPDPEAGGGWARKQTLKNAERFITPELKEFEGNVLRAGERAVAREQSLFAELCGSCREQIAALHGYADVAAELDVLLCFGRRAARHRYVCPELVDGPVLDVAAARHPVLDELLNDGLVPNDVALGRDRCETAEAATPAPSLALITGPNMAGKSTYIRTAALVTLLAHTGGFVPAERATVGLCDRIFTRVGAHDELHAGRSTFMVEMTETANICHHATPGSLVILDEIGRGTSTLDGLSLAWAIAEHLARVGCRCLFATHYHELTSLASDTPGRDHVTNAGVETSGGITNLNVTAREWNDQIVFLHRVAAGAADRSYGIQVARLAGLPDPVVKRAQEL
ncbi:MAG: DNA mismatch repair protein MutS, partial [Planctomycetota bacterium]